MSPRPVLEVNSASARLQAHGRVDWRERCRIGTRYLGSRRRHSVAVSWAQQPYFISANRLASLVPFLGSGYLDKLTTHVPGRPQQCCSWAHSKLGT